MVAPIFMAVAALVPLITSLIGQAVASGNHAEADRLERMRMDAINGVRTPDLEKLLQETQVGPSAMEGVQTDPRLRTAQMRALEQLERQGMGGGLTLGDRLAQEDAMGEAAAYERGQRGALQQSMAARGMAGSGLEAAQAMVGQQEGANRAARAGMSAAASAQERALRALEESGHMAGNIREQDWGEESERAAARDAVARFNAQARGDAYASDFDNRMRKAEAQAGVFGQGSESQRQRARETAATWGGVGQAGGQAAGAFAQYEDDRKRRYGGN